MAPVSLEQIFYLTQIAGSVGVIVSLVFVGLQIRQNTSALYRNEHNSTMTQWTVIRMAIVENRDIAELMTSGLYGDMPLDAADQFRLEQFLNEQVWAAFHIWDREQRGVFAKGTFQSTGGPLVNALLSTPRGNAWWRNAKNSFFLPPYVEVVDNYLAARAKEPAAQRATG